MDTFFLSRNVGSFEIGPQNFVGISIPGTTFYFEKIVEGPGLLNSVLVQNGGLNTLNGTFNYVSLFESKPYYNKNGDASLFIVWFNNQWQIYDFNEDVIDPIYFSNEDVLYPWNVTVWNSINSIYNPVPTVTKVL